ncbi:MAG: aminoacyl-tRNA hydrolase [Chloroflexi bacterium]|nr:aminoacyl-tRNA hydrolase [Chloroflexota bacterium]
MRLIVGLGNPGRRYLSDRHNVGYRCLEHLAQTKSLNFSTRTRWADLAKGELSSQPAILAKPRTFMNESGRAVRALLDRFHLRPAALLLIYDDLDLPLGRIRLRIQGSSGGHNGVQSVIDALGTQTFDRVRVGIGRPIDQDPIEYVLSDFSSEEAKVISATLPIVAEAVAMILSQGMEQAMNRFNALNSG